MNYSKKLLQNYSEYLSFRSFYTGYPVHSNTLKEINDVDEAKAFLTDRLGSLNNSAILLSGGMDSAILLPFMPKDTIAYTIYHEQLGDDNEISIARKYCEKFGIKHKVISVDPKDYFNCMDALMTNKKMPLSPAEPIFYLASKVAVNDGFDQVVTGAGADARLGGFNKDRRKYTIKSYQKRLAKTYVQPSKTLNHFANIENALIDYIKPTNTRQNKIINLLNNLLPFSDKTKIVDTKRFLNDIGYERFAYDNAIGLAGAEHISPLKEVQFNIDEDRNQKQPKYFIQDIYKDIYGYLPPKKKGLQKPSFLLKNYSPNNFDLFNQDLDVNKLTYDKKFLIYCLEKFEKLRLNGQVKVD